MYHATSQCNAKQYDIKGSQVIRSRCDQSAKEVLLLLLLLVITIIIIIIIITIIMMSIIIVLLNKQGKLHGGLRPRRPPSFESKFAQKGSPRAYIYIYVYIYIHMYMYIHIPRFLTSRIGRSAPGCPRPSVHQARPDNNTTNHITIHINIRI